MRLYDELKKKFNLPHNIQKTIIHKIIELKCNNNDIEKWIKLNTDKPSNQSLEEIIIKLDDEYNILTIIDQSELESIIIKNNYNMLKIRGNIEELLYN